MKALLLVIVSSLLIGCVSVGRKLDPTKVEQIKRGESTRADVLRLVGSPDQVTKMNDCTTFYYQHIRSTAKASSFIPVVGAFAGGANVENQFLMVTFGPDDKVVNVMSTYGATESGTGLNATPAAAMPQVQQGKRSQ